jgi:hypothetical protein
MSLIVMLEMEEAIPSQYATKSSTKSQASHVSDDPLLIRHPGSAKRNQRWRAVHAGDMKAFRRHVKRHRDAAPAPKV